MSATNLDAVTAQRDALCNALRGLADCVSVGATDAGGVPTANCLKALERARYVLAAVEPKGPVIVRQLVGHSYARNGNAHNPTPKYQWLVVGPDGRILDRASRKRALVASWGSLRVASEAIASAEGCAR